MKFKELELRAFGPFAGERLSFDGDGCVHLIYGNNEAGKSSLLRAVRAFLYGIPRKTVDAHRHPMTKLRLAAKVEVADGQVLELTRRKGNKNTLLDVGDKVVGEAEMARHLCGVGESLFNNLFGLDYESLRAGAESMLAGNGDVGESLFDAGGARGVHALLEELREERDAIYSARGQKPPLNAVLRSLKAMKKEVKERSVRGGDYDALREAFEQARKDYEHGKAQRRSLDIERSRIERTLRVAPLLARLDDLEQRLKEIQAVPPLAEDAPARRRAVLQQLQLGKHERVGLQQEIEELQVRCEQRLTFAPYLQVSDELLLRLKNGIGKYEAATRELPRRQQELQLRLAEIESIAAGLDRSVDALKNTPREAVLRSRLNTLVRDYERLQERLELVKEAHDEQSVKLEQATMRMAELKPQEEEERALSGAIREVLALGTIESEYATLDEQMAQHRARAAVLQGRLLGASTKGPDADAEHWLKCTLPSEARIQQRQRVRQAWQQERKQLDEEQVRLAQRLEDNRIQLDSIDLRGDLPSVAALHALREERDELFAQLLEQPTLADAYRRLRDQADRMADHLFQQAEKVTQHARYKAEGLGLERHAKLLHERQVGLVAAGKQADEAWASLWQPSTLKAGEVSLMAELRTAHEQWLGLQAAMKQLEQQRQRLEQREAKAMARLPGKADSSNQERLAVAEHSLERLKEERRRAQAMREQVKQLEDELASQHKRLHRVRSDVAAWKKRWVEAVAALGLPEGCPVADAVSYVQSVDSAMAKLDEAAKLERRILSMNEDAEAFRKSVHDLCESIDDTLLSQPLEQAAGKLVERCDRARFDAKELANAKAMLEKRSRALREVDRSLEAAQKEQDQLLEKAQVKSLDALEACEAENARRRQLRGERESALQQVLDAGEGAPLTLLRESQAGGDVDGMKARLNEISVGDEALEKDLETLRSAVADRGIALRQIEDAQAGASSAVAELECLRAEAERYTELYARKQLAVSLLEERVEAYRRENEGPVIGYARTMFHHLTLGGFVDLRVVQHAEKSALCAVRNGGEELGVEALSEGTRDQLYLALRLASLRRFSEAGTSLPLVLDDILVHFDERRSSAALALLAEVAGHNQVLLFTHHEHCIQLAEHAVGAERLRVHRLPDRMALG